jgi:hypothetical protein
MRDDGLLSPVEIGARSSGFICSPLVDIASGRDFLSDYMNVLQGAHVPNTFYQSSNSSMYFFYDFPPNCECRSNTALPQHLARGIESLYSDSMAIQSGRRYSAIDNDTERYGVEILRGARKVLTIEAVETAEKKMLATMFGCN